MAFGYGLVNFLELGHVINMKLYIQKYTDEPDSHLVVVFGSDTCGGNGVLKTLFELRIIWAGVDSILKMTIFMKDTRMPLRNVLR